MDLALVQICLIVALTIAKFVNYNNLVPFQPTSLSGADEGANKILPLDHHEGNQHETALPVGGGLVTINTPSSAFGCITEWENDLKQKYPYAYYESPVNVKQRQINKWGLQMASSSRHRHVKKLDHEKWCKEEIHRRTDIAISLADRGDFAGDSLYFKNKNLPTKLHNIKASNEDLQRLSASTVKRYQFERFVHN